MSLRSLYILPSNYCPLNCAHCAIQDKKEPRCDLNPDMVEQLIHDAPSQHFSISIISGGGEPFAVDESILKRILQASSRENLYAKMTTNVYWATSREEARRRLHPLTESGLKHIVVSISESHQEYVKHENILHAVQAANDLQLKCDLYLTTLNTQTNPLNGIVHYFVQHRQPPPHIFAEYYFIPFGNAGVNFDLSEFQLTDVAALQGACPSAGNNICVHPNGTVTPCAMVFSLHVPALHVGNAYRDSLATIMERVENSRLVQWLAVHGIVALKELIEQETPLRFPCKYVNICHLCSDLLRNREVLKFLQQTKLI